MDKMWDEMLSAWHRFLRVLESEHPGRGERFTAPLVADGLGPEADEGLYSS